MVVDGRSELLAPDRDLARLLLRSGKPLLLAVNKVDFLQMEPYVESYRELGLRELLPISAEHGTGVAELLEAVFAKLGIETAPGATDIEEEPTTSCHQPAAAT